MDSLVTFGKLTRGGGLVTKDAVIRGAFNQASNIGALIPETGPRPNLSDLARHLGCRLDELSEDFLSALFQGAMPASSTGSTTAARGCRSRSRPSSSSSIRMRSSSAASFRARFIGAAL
ncbi:hypothetical protein HJB56_09950 [Rhizobium lentis]|uniref:hypothetical protein n=1 Tax=Rhizobium lentis TaxID=1138194 RepID=UPI001C839932|nr:hypothetical protein [Rhizobium lentis]MBX5083084.1 hypothetical protein [Rhizobium lentis]MBX5095411.1 hypothetical protein [Rhizobium lentis]